MTVEREMSPEEVLKVLAGLKKNGRVTVGVGESIDHCMTIPGLHVLSMSPERAQPQDIQEVELSMNLLLKRSEEGWLLEERRGRARQFNLLAIEDRSAVAVA